MMSATRTTQREGEEFTPHQSHLTIVLRDSNIGLMENSWWVLQYCMIHHHKVVQVWAYKPRPVQVGSV